MKRLERNDREDNVEIMSPPGQMLPKRPCESDRRVGKHSTVNIQENQRHTTYVPEELLQSLSNADSLCGGALTEVSRKLYDRLTTGSARKTITREQMTVLLEVLQLPPSRCPAFLGLADFNTILRYQMYEKRTNGHSKTSQNPPNNHLTSPRSRTIYNDEGGGQTKRPPMSPKRGGMSAVFERIRRDASAEVTAKTPKANARNVPLKSVEQLLRTVDRQAIEIQKLRRLSSELRDVAIEKDVHMLALQVEQKLPTNEHFYDASAEPCAATAIQHQRSRSVQKWTTSPSKPRLHPSPITAVRLHRLRLTLTSLKPILRRFEEDRRKRTHTSANAAGSTLMARSWHGEEQTTDGKEQQKLGPACMTRSLMEKDPTTEDSGWVSDTSSPQSGSTFDGLDDLPIDQSATTFDVQQQSKGENENGASQSTDVGLQEFKCKLSLVSAKLRQAEQRLHHVASTRRSSSMCTNEHGPSVAQPTAEGRWRKATVLKSFSMDLDHTGDGRRLVGVT